MSKSILSFDNIQVKKDTFYNFVNPIDINEVKIDKIVISDKVWYDKNVLNALLDMNMMKK